MRPSNPRGPVSAEALFAVDGDQRIVAWNRQATAVFGYDLESALGAHCYQLLGCCDVGGNRFCRAGCAVISNATDGAAPPTLQLQARTRDGTRVPIEVSTIVLFSGDHLDTVMHLCRPVARQRAVTPTRPLRRSLTARERQVLNCLCRRSSTEEIAGELGISAVTVRNHMQHLLEKLAVHSRAEAVALAYDDGLFVLPGPRSN